MICRDFMLRVCNRNPCKMQHKVEKCTDSFCNQSNLCKKVHLTDNQLVEINNNIRPFQEIVFQEMKRLAFILRETFPQNLKTQVCTLNMLGECIWACFTCGTLSKCTNTLVCNKCYIVLTQRNLKALRCCHVYCRYCFERLSCDIKGPLPLFCCTVCDAWSTIFILY